MAEIASCGAKLRWWGLYKGQHELLTPSSYAHPAKMAPTLCYRIMEHLEELGLLKPESVVLDPMAGTGMTGLVAATLGSKSILVELEPKFCGFIRENKAALEKKLGHPIEMEIIQGDARNLSGLLRERGLVAVSSPPYGEAEGHPSLGSVNKDNWGQDGRGIAARRGLSADYGDAPGQIGQLPDKPLVITSPPYAGQNQRDISQENYGSKVLSGLKRNIRQTQPYSSLADNIGNLPDRPLTAVLSPPFEDSLTSDDSFKRQVKAGYFRQIRPGRKPDDPFIGGTEAYEIPNSQGQIGQEQGATYLSEMKIIYQELSRVADVLVVVVKNPTRNGKLRDLSGDTARLLEACGWRIHCWHHAMLFEEQEQGHLFDGSRKQVKGRMSFFKRLAYQKGSPVADHEDCIVAVKRLTGTQPALA